MADLYCKKLKYNGNFQTIRFQERNVLYPPGFGNHALKNAPAAMASQPRMIIVPPSGADMENMP